MSWASEFPNELFRRPTGLILFTGLDVPSNPLHNSVWESFTKNHNKVDKFFLHYKLHDINQELPKSRQKRPTYDWYIPKGILKCTWMKKHLEIIPSLVVLFIDYDWDDVQWKDKQAECLEKFKFIKNYLAGRATKIGIVLIQKNAPLPPGEDLVASERASSLCSSCDLSNKFLYVISVAENITGYTLRLEQAFADHSKTYYHTEARRAKAHKDLLNKTTHALLFVRHQFKIAFFNEQKQDLHAALKYYKQAYAYILELRFLDFNILEIKTIAGFLTYKICKLCFMHNTPLDAISQFRKHIDFFKNKPGIPELSFEHSAWMSKQFLVFADLFDEAIKQGLTAILTQHPGIYYQQAAHHSCNRRSLSMTICQGVPARSCSDLIEALNNLDYYGQRPWRQGHQSIEPPDLREEREGILSLQILEKQVDYCKIIIPILGYAITHAKKFKSPRMKRHLTVQLLREYYNANEFAKALPLLSRVTWEYRNERWWIILTSILQMALKCAYLSCSPREYVTICLELVGVYGMVSKDEKLRLQRNIQQIINGETPSAEENVKESFLHSAVSAWDAYAQSTDKKDYSIEMSCVHSFVEVRIQFAKEIFSVDTYIELQVFLRSHAPEPIYFKKLSITFNNSSYNECCFWQYNDSNSNFTSNRLMTVMSDGDDDNEDDYKIEEGVGKMLKLSYGKVKVVTFKFISLPSDVGGQIEVLSMVMEMGQNIKTEKTNLPKFNLLWNGTSLDSAPPMVCLQKNFFPEPSAIPKKDEDRWQAIRMEPFAKVTSRKPNIKLNVLHNAPGFVEEMLEFTVVVTSCEDNEIRNVRLGLPGSLIKSDHTDEKIRIIKKCIQFHPIIIDMCHKVPQRGTTTAKFYATSRSPGKLILMLSITYDIGIQFSKGETTCRCAENQLVHVDFVDPVDIDVVLLTPKLERILPLAPVDGSFIIMTALRNNFKCPIQILNSKLLLSDKAVLEDDPLKESYLQAEVIIQGEEASENFCVSADVITNQVVPLGQYQVFMTRQELQKYKPETDPQNFMKVFSKTITLPSVVVTTIPLEFKLDVASHGVVHNNLVTTYIIKNVSSVVQELQVSMEACDGFMFSGHKQVNLRVLPNSETRLRYNLVPVVPGNVMLPKLKIINIRFPDCNLDHYLQKSLPTHVFIRPKVRTSGIVQPGN
ncbi:hypothetical protein HELRODRAFT_99127 [Helobdella robusta]|uniref:Trafficking protein particle complex subunit 11 n=1 Tax=Helobdella robusta TaxID=6412 RepID=T1G9R1_HELRO|nr:hypothetical protein HELRODRAFT_99127 [Helobdella robusta]ESO05264.1 hypothetical protein HELRODRAFT_99127 [Helobdella robusta]